MCCDVIFFLLCEYKCICGQKCEKTRRHTLTTITYNIEKRFSLTQLELRSLTRNMDTVGQWCALCRGDESKKDGDRKLAVVCVVSSSSAEENVLCLLHYAVRYLNEASATVKGIYLSLSLSPFRLTPTTTHDHSYRCLRTSKTITVCE